MYPTPNEFSSYSPAWPCAHFRLAGGVNALAGVLLLRNMAQRYNKLNKNSFFVLHGSNTSSLYLFTFSQEIEIFYTHELVEIEKHMPILLS